MRVEGADGGAGSLGASLKSLGFHLEDGWLRQVRSSLPLCEMRMLAGTSSMQKNG